MPRRPPPETDSDADDGARVVEDYQWDQVRDYLFDPKLLLGAVLVLFLGTRLWLLVGFQVIGADTAYYADFARQGVDLQRVAYRDFALEYPPLAWWVIALPRLVDSDTYLDSNATPERVQQFFDWYFWWFHAELLLADTVSLILMYLIGRKMLPKAPWVLPGAYTLLTIAQPNLLYDRLDIGLMMFFLLFIECWLRSLEKSSAANLWATASYLFLGLGISFKIMPVIFVPFLLLADWWAAGSAWKFVGRVVSLAVGALGPFLVYVPAAGWGVLKLFKYHSERGTNMESIWSSIMMAAARFGVPCSVYHSHGGYNLASDWSPALKIVSNVALLAMAASLGLWALLRWKRYDRRLALDTAILALVNSTVLSHVYSPQYLNWLLPLSLLLALNILPRHWVIWSVFVMLVSAIVGLSGWLYPYHYMEEFLKFKPLAVDVCITRSACLVGLGLLLSISFFAKYGLSPWRAGEAVPRALAKAA